MEVLLALLLAAFTCAAFWPILGNSFVNWDDPDALVRNPGLDAPGVVSWAFRTTHMSHYQPLSWLAWRAARRLFGTGPEVHHAASLALHVLNTLLVYLLARRLGGWVGLDRWPARAAALAGALLFAVHPLRVEPVAWASGFPYVLALAPLLVCLLAYVNHAASGGAPFWLAVALAAYALSLLARAVAPGLPMILLGVDVLAGRLRTPAERARVAIEKLPFVLLAVGATLAEGSARRFAPFEQVGPGARLSDAALAPALYLWRTVAPFRLSPLQPLPLDPRTSWLGLTVGLAFLAAVTAVAWKARRIRPEWLLLWLSFLALLGPALGLAPSGLQVTADRYTYFPGVAVGLAAGTVLARAWPRAFTRRALIAGAAAVIALLAVTCWRQARFWRDSVTLWTWALELDPRNDIALYNLAAALAERGDHGAAAERYRQLLQIIPEHGPARRNQALLEAAGLERQAAAHATAGRLAEAVALYTESLERDPARMGARASRGMALVQLGRFQEALPDLRSAVGSGGGEPELASALAFALLQVGMERDARRILEEALGAHPEDLSLAHNLARLLATAADPGARDGARALGLAQRVVQATGQRDPRALDTLSAAYAACGRWPEAARTAGQAAARARASGQLDLARAIQARARAASRAAPSGDSRP